MPDTKEKLKKVLHIRSKSKASQAEEQSTLGVAEANTRPSYDEELAAMDPSERERYLKEIEEAEQTDNVKKGSFLEKLIMSGNKRTEDQLAAEQLEREERDRKAGVIR